MKRLFRALRGPFVGAYDTRLPAQSKAPYTSASPTRRGVEPSGGGYQRFSLQESQINLPHSRTAEVQENTATADSSEKHVEEVGGLWPTICVTPAVLKSIEEIGQRERTLASLQRRLRKANVININDEGRLQILQSDLNKGQGSNEANMELRNTLERLEKAYQYSCNVKEMLTSAIKSQEMNTRFAREELESEIRTLLLPLGILEESNAHSEMSQDDFADAVDENHKTESDTVEDAADPPEVDERNAEEEAKAEAAQIYKDAKRLLQSVQLKYDIQLGFLTDDLEMYAQAVEEETCDIPQTEFDLEQLMRIQETTRELIEAEQAYSEVGWQVMDMGAIEFTPSQTSRFVDQPEDGEGLQEEADRALKATDVSRIERWKDQLDDAKSTDSDEVDEAWDVRTIDLGESCSVVADGREGVRIARWNRVRGEDWQAMKERDLLKPGPVQNGVFMLNITELKVRATSRARSCTW